ncbi:MAG: mechanosensitive ion channel domain-containing protein [Verrucomicrobiota bacterium]
MTFGIHRTLLVLLGLLAVFSPLDAQVPGLPSVSKTAGTPKPAETPEEAAARLDQWQKEAKTAIDRLNEPGAENRLPEGIDSAALSDYRRDLEQILLSVGRNRKILAATPEARKALEAARAADAAWTGFAEKPPYSILMIDEFVNQQEAIKDKAASYRSSLAHFGMTLTGLHEESRRAEESSRRILAEASETGGDTGAGQWRLTADRAKMRLMALHATFLQNNIALLEEQSETTKSQLSLLNRQIAIAMKQPAFTDDDLAKVKKVAADRRAGFQKEIGTVRKRQQEANAARVKAQAAFDQIVKAAPEGTNFEQSPELALAGVKLEAAEAKVDALQFVTETLDSIDRLASYAPDVYEARKKLLEKNPKDIRESAMQVLDGALDRLKAWEIVVTNELTSVNADISKLESRATLIPAEDPRLVPINDLRSSLWERQAVIQRVSQAVAAQRRMVKRWVAGFTDSSKNIPLSEKISDGIVSARDLALRIWNFEVFQYDETEIIGGLPITQKNGVTLGKFIIALLLFGFAYFVSTRIKNRLQGTVVRRGHIAEAQARTLSNWLMIVVGLLLALATLHFLRIPLTVFAFFGGALAIGLGFGTQTLIKNFISGIIVLFERKIRVGDVVDIGTTSGTVVEVNTRSSVLRGADGRESLVPNSLFLENTITNRTLSDRTFRRFINIGVSYGSSPSQVIEILTECAERHGLVLKDPAPTVLLQDFGDNALIFRLYLWVAQDGKINGEMVESDLRLMIDKRFGEVGILFPYPQTDIHLKTEAPIQIELGRPTPPQA